MLLCSNQMGIGTITEARHIILLATGENKGGYYPAGNRGPVTAQVTLLFSISIGCQVHSG